MLDTKLLARSAKPPSALADLIRGRLPLAAFSDVPSTVGEVTGSIGSRPCLRIEIRVRVHTHMGDGVAVYLTDDRFVEVRLDVDVAKGSRRVDECRALDVEVL
jgi:hypothetical protein